VTGILLLDKPLGMSSNHALQRVRHLLGGVKAGHVGSLDPLATGMLPICLGEATKIAGEILARRKHYQFTVKLGDRTSTGDAEGAVVESAAVPHFDRTAIETVLKRFVGRQCQTPPMHSAIKQSGRPLYKLAREGKEVARLPREIEIFELMLAGLQGAELQLATLCSKGTYVRVLAEDVARALGTCGHVIKLHRTYVEPFATEPMESLESIARGPRILPADRGVEHLPAVRLSIDSAGRLMHGQAVALEIEIVAGRVRLYDQKGQFLGIGEASAGLVRPRRLFALVAGQGPRVESRAL
jgi:tRNA pseudouridine55 synthase